MGRVGSLMQQLQHPRNLAHLLEKIEQSAIQLDKEAELLYMAGQGDRAIIYGWTRRQGYYIRLDFPWG